MSKPVILTDIDGVVLNWEEAFHVWMEHHGHLSIKSGRFSYNIHEKFNITASQGGEMIKLFNESAAIGFLPPLRDSQQYIGQLSDQGYRFLAVTSLSIDPYAKKLRERNLKKLYGKKTFVDVICLDVGAPKREILTQLANDFPGAVWIEDKPENADVGVELGYDTLLMEHAYNMNYQGGAKIVRNWKEIHDYINAA